MLRIFPPTKLIRRPRHPDHGRILQTELTDDGRGKLAEADRSVIPIVDQMVGGIDRADQLRLLEMLTGCRDRLTRPRQ